MNILLQTTLPTSQWANDVLAIIAAIGGVAVVLTGLIAAIKALFGTLKELMKDVSALKGKQEAQTETLDRMVSRANVQDEKINAVAMSVPPVKAPDILEATKKALENQ